ncbi:type I secretion system permease/ATPase [Acuticoccus sp.]|uniref:type I secretion system permease/ATPase n=1 Tax=Acuticoccus sp. TaxID=1904378 RepID=UPI003B52F0D7
MLTQDRFDRRRCPTELQRALSACRGTFGLVFAYSCGYNLLLLAPPLFLLQIYDRVLPSRSVDTLVMLTGIIAAAVLVDAALDSLRRGIMARLGLWLEDRLRPSALSATFAYAERRDRNVAAETYRDLTALRQFIGSPGCLSLFDLPWAIVFVGLLFLVDPLLGGIAATGVLVMVASALGGELLTRDAINRAQVAEARVQQRLSAAVGNLQAIRAMGMLDGVARSIGGHQLAARAAQGSALRRGEAFQALSRATRSLAQVLIMGAAAWLVLRDHLNPGIIFVASLLLGRGLGPIEGAIVGWKALGSVRLAHDRLTEVLSTGGRTAEPQVPPTGVPRGELRVRNMTYVPQGTTSLVLQGVSLTLSPGECLCIVGPTGSGKTTLGRVIAGTLAPTVGRVQLDDIDVGTWVGGSGARHLGYLPPEPELFEGTIAENIARLGPIDMAAVTAAAKLVGVHAAIMQLAAGYDTELSTITALPGGHRQRIALARAFFGRPQLVVLDEPYLHLDDCGERALLHAVAVAKAGGTVVVLIAHRVACLTVADKVAVLQGGTLARFGPTQEIYEKRVTAAEASPPTLDQGRSAVMADAAPTRPQGSASPVSPEGRP